MSKTILNNAIKAKIQALEGFEWGGLFNNQFDEEATEDATRYPIVYAEYSPIEWSAATGNNKNLQKGDVEVILHIGFKTLKKDNDEVLSLVDQVFAALHGYGSEDFDPLRRIREIQDTQYNNVLVWLLTFKTTLTDCGAADLGSVTHVIEELDTRTESELIIEPDAEGEKIVRTASKPYFTAQIEE
jgi:hypothetical protein